MFVVQCIHEPIEHINNEATRCYTAVFTRHFPLLQLEGTWGEQLEATAAFREPRGGIPWSATAQITAVDISGSHQEVRGMDSLTNDASFLSR